MSATASLVEWFEPGAHICFIYDTEQEHRKLVTRFLSAGLAKGQKVICILDDHCEQTITQYLSSEGLDVDAALAKGQLVLLGSGDTYLDNGTFCPDRMLVFLRDQTDAALEEGYGAVRVTSEMTWAIHEPPGSNRLIEYESKLNDFLTGSKCLKMWSSLFEDPEGCSTSFS